MKRKLLPFLAFLTFFQTDAARAETAKNVSALIVTAENDTARRERIAAGLSQVFGEAGIKLSLSYAAEKCGTRPSALYSHRNKSVDFIIASMCRQASAPVNEEPAAISTPVFLVSGDFPADVSPAALFRLAPSFNDTLRDLAEKLTAAADDPVFVVANESDLAVLKGMNAVAVPNEDFNKKFEKIIQPYKNKRKIHLVTEQTPQRAAERVTLLIEAGVKENIFGLQPFETKEFSKLLGDRANGLRFYNSEPFRFSLDATALVAELRCGGEGADEEKLSAYAAGQIFIRMMKNKEKQDDGMSFKTILGTLRFQADGRCDDGRAGRFFIRRGKKIEILTQPFEK